MTDEKETRFAVCVDFYVWATSDEQAVEKAQEIAEELQKKHDNRASIQSIHEQPHGKRYSRKIK